MATDNVGNVQATPTAAQQTIQVVAATDTTPPTSSVVNALGTTQASDTFTVSVAYTDPAGANGAPPSGVKSIDLYVSVNGGTFSLYQTQTLASPSTSGTINFSFAGQDRNLYAFHSIAHDAAGNVETKPSILVEASTYVPDLNPPVTQVLNTTSYNSSTGAFTVNWSGTDPDQNTGTPAGSISVVDLYVVIDGGTPNASTALIGQYNAGTPNAGVYSGSVTYSALADGVQHTYGFYSVGEDDQREWQAAPATPNLTLTETYTPPAPLSASLVVEKGIAERSYIRYLDVAFNYTTSTSTALQSLASGVAGASRSTYVELVYFGENVTSTTQVQGSVNLAKAVISLSGNDMSIDLGTGGLTSQLSGSGVSGTPSTNNSVGDGWYALGIDTAGTPGQVTPIWLPFFRLLGSATGDTTVTGPYTSAGTDASTVYHAIGQSGSLLNADVNGDGYVNSRDSQDVNPAVGHAVGTGPQASNDPTFQLLAGASPIASTAAPIGPVQVRALLPAAIDAWEAAGLDAAECAAARGRAGEGRRPGHEHPRAGVRRRHHNQPDRRRTGLVRRRRCRRPAGRPARPPDRPRARARTHPRPPRQRPARRPDGYHPRAGHHAVPLGLGHRGDRNNSDQSRLYYDAPQYL